MGTNHEDFTNDIIIEVLLKLPVKSLLRFRCICKHWYILFKDPRFISQHLKNDNNNRLYVCYMIVDDPDDYPTDFLGFFPDETLADLFVQDLDLMQSIREIIAGPFDGIFCIRTFNNNRITLWNLSTKEIRALPKHKIVLPCNTSIFHTHFGFGFDTRNNDYKLVMLFTLWDKKRNLTYELLHVAVYTLGTNSWRNFGCFRSNHCCTNHIYDGTYLDGVYYWLSSFLNDDINQKVLISFHMGYEVFQEIPLGPHISKVEHLTIGVYNCSLSLLLLDQNCSCFEIWVMKERYWNNILTIRPITGLCKPLGFWKKGAFFIHSSTRQLLLYDPNTQEMRDLGLNSHFFSVSIYKESLITLKGDDNLLELFDIPWDILGVYQTD